MTVNQLTHPRRITRRDFAAGAVALAALPLLSQVRRAAADGFWEVYATSSWDEYVDLTSESNGGDYIASLEPGTTLQLLDGPSYEGWYYVDPIELPDVPPGWVAGWQLIFEQRARAFVDQTLLASPGDWATEVGPLRRGFTVTLIGPVTGDRVLVRSGERIGYASVWTIEPTDGPETDRTAEYWAEVNRSTAEVFLFVGDSLVDRYEAQLSSDQGEGFYATAVGTYWIYEKIEELTYTPFASAYFKFWVGFDAERLNGFHSWIMDAEGNLLGDGSGPTAGCVATAPDDAWSIFQFLDVGSRVEIHW